MDKLKIESTMIPETGTVELRDDHGNAFLVKRHIPYAQKEMMALEISAFLMITDDEKKMVYENFKSFLLETMLICKHYTTIDVTELGSEEKMCELFDYLTFTGLYGMMMETVAEDYRMVRAISDKMLTPACTAYERENSLTYKISNLFGDALNSETLAETIAKSDAVNNTMVDLIGAYRDQKDRNAKKEMALGNGAVISLAKKKK